MRRSVQWVVVAAALCAISSNSCRASADTISNGFRGIPAADSLTVERCVAMARRQAPAIVAAVLDGDAAASDSAATAKNRRPGFSLVSSATVAPKGFYDPTLTNLGDYQLKLGMSWTVADGGLRARARERGGIDLSAARSRAALESREAGLRAGSLAFGLLQLAETESYQIQALDWLNRLGTLIRAGVASGVRSSGDSIRVALERDAVSAALENTHLARRISTLELLALLGRDAESTVKILDPEGARERVPTEPDSIRLMVSVERQPEVILARAADAAARLSFLDARHRTAPQVDLTLDAGLAGADLTGAVPRDLRYSDPSATFADRLRRDLGASAAIHLRLPLFDGAAIPATRARETAVRASEVRSRSEAINQRGRALSLFAQWRSASRRTDAARETSDRAETNLLKIKSLYSAGATTLLDLLDARRVYEEARLRLADARWDQRMAQFQVEDRR
jgi:outer membrane protein TolC